MIHPVLRRRTYPNSAAIIFDFSMSCALAFAIGFTLLVL